MVAEPNSVTTPAVAFRSLIAVGTPASGPSPRGVHARAASAVTVTNAPTVSDRRSIRSR